MKIMYRTNLIIFLINIVFALLPLLGMVFLIPLGFVQVVSSIWLSTQYKRTSRTVQVMTTIHLVLSFLVLGLLFFLGNDNHHFSNDTEHMLFISGMIVSVVLALFFMFTAYTSHTENEKRLEISK